MYRVTERNVTRIRIKWTCRIAIDRTAKFSISGLRFILSRVVPQSILPNFCQPNPIRSNPNIRGCSPSHNLQIKSDVKWARVIKVIKVSPHPAHLVPSPKSPPRIRIFPWLSHKYTMVYCRHRNQCTPSNFHHRTKERQYRHIHNFPFGKMVCG